MYEVIIATEYIKLDQLLKLSGLAETGGEAKNMIIDECVEYNGEVCTARGKKCYVNDIITIHFEDGDVQIKVICNEN